MKLTTYTETDTPLGPVSQALKDAFKLFRGGRAWTKGDLYNHERPDFTCYCAVAALRVLDLDNEIERAAVGYLSENSNGLTVPQMNDRPETTWEDIKKMYRRAFRSAKAEGA